MDPQCTGLVSYIFGLVPFTLAPREENLVFTRKISSSPENTRKNARKIWHSFWHQILPEKYKKNLDTK
jgi:hypothetical protein